MATVDDAIGQLTERASEYGGTLMDILDLTPVSLWDSPNELIAYWDGRDLSHIFSRDLYPHLTTVWGNIIGENPDFNRPRGNTTMTTDEYVDAQIDNAEFATEIEQQFTDDSMEHLGELLDFVL